MVVILTRNDIVFQVFYYTSIILLSSLITYKIRQPVCKWWHLPPPNKMRWQTILAMFLMHLFMIVILFATMPYYDPSGNELEITVAIAFSLGAFLAAIYTIWYFVNYKLYAGFDFFIIIVVTMYANVPIYYMELSPKDYFEVWGIVSRCTYMSFVFAFMTVMTILDFITRIFPNSWEVLKEMWNGDKRRG